MSTALPLADGYHDVPAGKIASVVTYLEMTAPPVPRPVPDVGDATLVRLRPDETARYLRIYRAIGERWFWFSRLSIAEPALRAILDDPGILAHAVRSAGEDVGIVELDLRTAGEAEIVYFGLIDAATGRGLGRWAMEQALQIAWSALVSRVWLHTCTLDHPAAVPFYRRSGFTPYKLALEIADDPRLTGALPRDAFPDVPLVPPA